MKKIPRSKCLEVFNSVILFEGFRELLKAQSNPTSKLNLANKDFNEFIRSHEYPPRPHKIEGGAKTLSFSYLTRVRVQEVMNRYLDEQQIIGVYSQIWGTEHFTYKNFKAIERFFEFTFSDFDHGEEDTTSLRRFIKYLAKSHTRIFCET